MKRKIEIKERGNIYGKISYDADIILNSGVELTKQESSRKIVTVY